MGFFDSMKDTMASSRLSNPQLKHRGAVSGDRVEDFWADLERTYETLNRVDLTRGYSLADLAAMLVQMRRYEILYAACIGWGCEPTTTIGERLRFAINRSRPSDTDIGGINELTLNMLVEAHWEAGRRLTEEFRSIADRRVRLAHF